MLTVRNVVTILQPEPGAVKDNEFPAATACYLGIVHIVVGALAFILQIVALAKDAGADRAGHGMWGGAVFIFLGSIAIYAACKPHAYLLAGLLTTSILSLLTCAMVFICAAIGLAADDGWNNCEFTFGPCRDPTDDYTWRLRLALNALLLLLSLLEMPLSLWTLAICGQVQIVLATSTMELPESHQNVSYNHYGEGPPPVRTVSPAPPRRSNSSRDVSRQLAAAHGYGAQPDHNSNSMNRRAPLPAHNRPVSQASTLPRSYAYDNMAAEVRNSSYSDDYKDYKDVGTM